MTPSEIADLISIRNHVSSVVYGTANLTQIQARGLSSLLTKLDRALNVALLAFDPEALLPKVEDDNDALAPVVAVPAAPKVKRSV
jgi:hypothetical protein